MASPFLSLLNPPEIFDAESSGVCARFISFTNSSKNPTIPKSKEKKKKISIGVWLHGLQSSSETFSTLIEYILLRKTSSTLLDGVILMDQLGHGGSLEQPPSSSFPPAYHPFAMANAILKYLAKFDGTELRKIFFPVTTNNEENCIDDDDKKKQMEKKEQEHGKKEEDEKEDSASLGVEYHLLGHSFGARTIFASMALLSDNDGLGLHCLPVGVSVRSIIVLDMHIYSQLDKPTAAAGPSLTSSSSPRATISNGNSVEAMCCEPFRSFFFPSSSCAGNKQWSQQDATTPAKKEESVIPLPLRNFLLSEFQKKQQLAKAAQEEYPYCPLHQKDGYCSANSSQQQNCNEEKKTDEQELATKSQQQKNDEHYSSPCQECGAFRSRAEIDMYMMKHGLLPGHDAERMLKTKIYEIVKGAPSTSSSSSTSRSSFYYSIYKPHVMQFYSFWAVQTSFCEFFASSSKTKNKNKKTKIADEKNDDEQEKEGRSQRPIEVLFIRATNPTSSVSDDLWASMKKDLVSPPPSDLTGKNHGQSNLKKVDVTTDTHLPPSSFSFQFHFSEISGGGHSFHKSKAAATWTEITDFLSALT